MPDSIECRNCKEVYEEVKKLEGKNDERYMEFKKCSIEYKAKKEQEIATLNAIHLRMDKQDEQRQELKEVVTKHMDTEDAHNLKMEKYMSQIDEVLKHVATKDDIAQVNQKLEKTNGRVNTLWIVGTLAGLFLIGLLAIFGNYIAEDIKSHTTKSSKANYNGVKKAIKQQEQR